MNHTVSINSVHRLRLEGPTSSDRASDSNHLDLSSTQSPIKMLSPILQPFSRMFRIPSFDPVVGLVALRILLVQLIVQDGFAELG